MSSTRQPHFALLLALAWLLIVAQLLAQSWAETGRSLIDTDDAMRLVQARDWLAGQGWYDLRQYGVAVPYESHWSRLIDAGLGGMLWGFGLFAEPAMAERLTRTVWPMLWLLPTMAGAGAIAWRIAGREAALVALLMAVIGLPALHQFRPGRIDHHNVQIALSLLAVAATVWSDRVRWAAMAAGAVTGLALAIGLECLPYLLVCGAAFAARYAMDAKAARAASDYGLALAVSSVAAFIVIVPPTHWAQGVCDAIAINWVALTAAGGLGLAFAVRHASSRLPVRCGQVLLAGVLAAVLFVAIEPRCLRGPYAMMDPAVWPVWLAHVREMKPLLSLMAEAPVIGIAIATFPAAALVAVLILMRQRDLRTDFAFLAASAAFLVAALATLAAVKSASYATWLAMPLVAAFAVHLFTAFRLESLLPRVAVGVLLTPAVLSLGAITIANAAGIGAKDNPPGTSDACFKNDSYAGLAKLPAGRVAADPDFGPLILALTRHSVLAVPYHRLSAGILVVHEVMTSPPDEARRILKGHSVQYVVTCGPRPPLGLAEAALPASLWGQLQAGTRLDWLEPLPGAGPMKVYRLTSLYRPPRP